MKLGYVILYVADISQSIDFYEKAFALKHKFIDESGQYAEIDTGSTTLAFASNELAKSNLPNGFQENHLSHPLLDWKLLSRRMMWRQPLAEQLRQGQSLKSHQFKSLGDKQ